MLPPSRFLRLHRTFALISTLVLLFSIAVPAFSAFENGRAYALSVPTKSLVGSVSSNLQSQLKFNKEQQVYEFNYESRKSDAAVASSSGKPFDPKSYNPFKTQVGGDAKGVKETYSFDLPADLSKGASLYDTNLGLSFSLVPQFKTSAVKDTDGHLVYPFTNGQAIYTPKSNGLKEDIILTRSHGETVEYDYQLKLPEELEARTLPDGGIGIYSGDPSLYGNISFGTNVDQEKVMSARKKGDKSNLVFAIPPPTIKEALKDTSKASTNGTKKGTPSKIPTYSGSVPSKDIAQAWFSLEGTTLKLKAKGLNSLAYPLSLDPSVVVNTTAGFALGNDEGSIDYPANQVNRGGLSGGTVGTWAATTSFTDGRQNASTVVYNGYIYVIAGHSSAANTGCNPVTSQECSDVQYALLCTGSNNGVGGCTATVGTLGTWTLAANHIGTGGTYSPRNGHTSVAYNGYLYVMGGENTNFIADVWYTPFCTATNNGVGGCTGVVGSVGTWIQSTHVYTTARWQHASAVYNGYIYVLGGDEGTIFSPTQGADVQYTKIQSNGDVGSWAATTSFTTGRYAAQVQAYNGYMYIFGGHSSVDLSDVQYAPIKTDGTLGTWVATTSFTTARQLSVSTIFNGYIYLMGGFTTVDFNDDQYAQINANGTIGTWSTTTAFPTARDSATMGIANGYVYILGGAEGSPLATDVQYAKFDVAGVLGKAWAAQTSFTTARDNHTSVAYNGFLYVIGGFTNAVQAGVQYATISASGAIGTWNPTTAFTTARQSHSSVVFNGYLYVAGGINGAGTGLSDVQYALICTGSNSGTGGCTATAGTVGTWTAVTHPLPGLIGGHSSVVYNGYMYVIGGIIAGVAQSSVYYSLICDGNNSGTAGCTATTGDVGTWNTANSLLAARGYLSSVVSGGYLYTLGGLNGGVAQNSVYYALICTGSNSGTGGCTVTAGSLGTMNSTTSFTTARYQHAAVVFNNKIYVLGGHAAGNFNDVQFATINTDGTIGSWTTTLPYTTATYGLTSVAYNGYLYAIGGFAAAVVATVQVAPINNGGNGITGAWAATTPLASTRTSHASIANNGYLFVSGGVVGGLNANDVQSAPINTVGTIVAWTATTSFATARYGHTMVAYQGYMYILGGFDGVTWYNDVQYALICTGANNGSGGCGATAGKVGTWATTTAFTNGRQAHTSIAYNGYLYIIGGAGSSNYADVQYALICTGANSGSGGCGATAGTVGTWASTTTLAGTISGHTSMAYNGYLYVLGGSGASGSVNDVQYALICTGANSGSGGCGATAGTVGTWAYTTKFHFARFSHSGFAANGYVYIMGGTGPSGKLNDTQFAPVHANGSLGNWQFTTAFATPRNFQTTVYYNGFAYLIGGTDGTATDKSDVQYVSITTIPRTGIYSQVLDIGGTGGTVTSYSINGTTTGTINTIYATSCPAVSNSYSAESSVLPIQNAKLGIANNLSGAARYFYINAQLDDSSSGTFPDTQSSINNITLNYTVAAGATTIDPHTRLYAGKFFKTEILQPLDTTKALVNSGGGGGC